MNDVKPLTPDETKAINELIIKMPTKEKDILRSKIPQGHTVLVPFIRDLINKK